MHSQYLPNKKVTTYKYICTYLSNLRQQHQGAAVIVLYRGAKSVISDKQAPTEFHGTSTIKHLYRFSQPTSPASRDLNIDIFTYLHTLGVVSLPS